MEMAQLPLPRWEVDLHGDDRDLQHLAQHFIGEEMRIYKDESTDQTLLVIGGFSAEASPNDVLIAATEKVKVLSGVLKVAHQAQTSLSVGGVMLRQLDGTRHVYASMLVTLGVNVEIHAEVLRRDRNGELVPVPQPAPLTVRLATLAQTDPVVATAMRLAVMPDAGTWRGLVPLFEVIEHDVLGAGSSVVKNGWASKTQQKRFEHTANSSAAGDASRHGHQRFAPPANPMTLDEARSFVQMVLHAWIGARLTRKETAVSLAGASDWSQP